MRHQTPMILLAAAALATVAACSSSDADSTSPAEAATSVTVAPSTPPTDPSEDAGTPDTTTAPTTTEPAVVEMPTTPLRFAMPPGVDDPAMLSMVDDVAALISEAVGREVITENPADYMAVVEAIRGGFVDVGFMTPFVTALAIENGSVDPLIVWESEQLPAAYCLVRADSPIQGVEDLRGAQIAFVDPGSTTGHFMPRSWLAQNGLDYGVDYESRFAGGHDTAILALLNDSVDMACTARQLYPIFIDAGLFTEDDVRIIGETGPIPVGVSIVVRTDMDQATRDALAATVPDALMSDPMLVTLVGGATDYIVNPGRDAYAPLLQVAADVGLNIEDLR